MTKLFAKHSMNSGWPEALFSSDRNATETFYLAFSVYRLSDKSNGAVYYYYLQQTSKLQFSETSCKAPQSTYSNRSIAILPLDLIKVYLQLLPSVSTSMSAKSTKMLAFFSVKIVLAKNHRIEIFVLPKASSFPWIWLILSGELIQT